MEQFFLICGHTSELISTPWTEFTIKIKKFLMAEIVLKRGIN